MMKKLLFGAALFISFQVQSQFFEGFNTTALPDISTGEWNLASGVWHVSDNGIGLNQSWTFNNTFATPPLQYEGIGAAYVNRENIGMGNTSEDWLVSPGVAATVDTHLDFYGRTTIFGNQGTFYQVKVSTTSATDHSSFITVGGWNESDLNPAFNILLQKHILLGQFAGQTVYVAFVMIHTQPTPAIDGDRWIIDNVSISDVPLTYNNISGSISYGLTTADCNALNPIPVSLSTQDGPIYSNQFGYAFDTTQTNILLTPLITNSYFAANPPVQSFNFSGLGNVVDADFCITPVGIHPDLQMSANSSSFKPGHNPVVSIQCNNVGNQVQSGSFSVNYDDSKLDLVFANPAPDSQGNGYVSWNFSNLEPFKRKTAGLKFYVHTPMGSEPANVGDVLNFTTTASSPLTDETPADNVFGFNPIIVNSFDPNSKIVLEGETIPISETGNYLHYVIQFQNLGTAPATNVKIHDNFDANLDLDTFEMVESSHNVRIVPNGNNLEFAFDNINLPAESQDEEASHGYIAYRIKPKNTVGLGSVISNTANIYFDYNYPITTNTVTTTVTALGTNDFNLSGNFSLYPNPVKNTLTIDLKDNLQVKTISIINTLGQLVKAIPPGGNSITADVSDLNSGTYFIQVISDTGKTSKKLIKL